MNIAECDLRVTVGPLNSGPERLATQLTNPLPGFEFVLTSLPYLRLSTCMSSSNEFLADDLVVVYMVS